MKIIAPFLLFLFFSFLTVQSASVFWQEDDSVSVLSFSQEEEEEDEQARKNENLKKILQFENSQILKRYGSATDEHNYDISDIRLNEEVNRHVPYSPPDKING